MAETCFVNYRTAEKAYKKRGELQNSTTKASQKASNGKNDGRNHRKGRFEFRTRRDSCVWRKSIDKNNNKMRRGGLWGKKTSQGNEKCKLKKGRI